jgi:hypothetical protein
MIYRRNFSTPTTSSDPATLLGHSFFHSRLAQSPPPTNPSATPTNSASPITSDSGFSSEPSVGTRSSLQKTSPLSPTLNFSKSDFIDVVERDPSSWLGRTRLSSQQMPTLSPPLHLVDNLSKLCLAEYVQSPTSSEGTSVSEPHTPPPAVSPVDGVVSEGLLIDFDYAIFIEKLQESASGHRTVRFLLASKSASP